MKICLLTGMCKRPIGFVSVHSLNDGCDSNLQNLIVLKNRIQIYGDIKQDFSVCFFELERQLRECDFLPHVDLAVRVHGVDIPVVGGGHVEFPILRLVFDGDEEFEAGCLP